MVAKGDKYECGTCGMVVAVDTACDCVPCEIMCCGVPMKEVKAKPKAKK
jgi:hypothetical protein